MVLSRKGWRRQAFHDPGKLMRCWSTTWRVALAPVRFMDNPLAPCRRFERCRGKDTAGCTCDGVLTATSASQEVAALRNKLSLAEAGENTCCFRGPGHAFS